ncbi:hypothetical protein BDZ89DRAFT_1067909 [Hymenopellis radicata]|nr:hypothetical protein BDZ89DRAFT_1067909 [Hymenopellis radicata]
MHFRTIFTTLVLTVVSVSVNASPKMPLSTKREMKAALEKKENCYCYDVGASSVVCGRSVFAVNREFYCPGYNQLICCDDCSSHGC